MRHRKLRRKLQRSHNERSALISGLVKNLLIHQRIRTTHVKAKAAQGLADQMITLGKADTVHARREAFKVLGDRTLVRRLFTEIAPLFKNRQGGYTRVLHFDFRKGDGAPMSILELVDKKHVPVKPSKKAKSEAAAAAAGHEGHGHGHAAHGAEGDAAKAEAKAKSDLKKAQREAREASEAANAPGKSAEKKTSFVSGLKKFFKRKDQG